MTQDAVVWAQLVGAVSALVGLLASLLASRLLRNSWFQNSKAGERITLVLFIASFAFAFLASTLVWKAVGLCAFFFLLGFGSRRPKQNSDQTS